MSAKCQVRIAKGQKAWLALRWDRNHATLCYRLFNSRLGETRPRGGMTLIELLVVIIILTTLVAAAIPLMSPANDDRRVREATRGLNTFITGAQARAIALNRPFGVALKRLSQDTKNAADNGVCLEVFYVEQPAPYSGFDANSRAAVAIHPRPLPSGVPNDAVLVRFITRGMSVPPSQDGSPGEWDPDLFPEAMIRPGDVVEVAGTRYELLPIVNDNFGFVELDAIQYFKKPGSFSQSFPVTIVARPINNTGQQLNPKYDGTGNELGRLAVRPNICWTEGAPYRILRQATPATDEPYQLPEGTAIDLRASGVGSDSLAAPNLDAAIDRIEFFYTLKPSEEINNSAGVLIMFTPEGCVARVTFSQIPHDDSLFDAPVTENVYLLVGKRENVPAPEIGVDPTLNNAGVAAADTDEKMDEIRQPLNWLGGVSRWVVIGSQSGRIATIENAMVNLSDVLATGIPQSTEQLRSVQILAAREFTREMSQLGGR